MLLSAWSQALPLPSTSLTLVLAAPLSCAAPAEPAAPCPVPAPPSVKHTQLMRACDLPDTSRPARTTQGRLDIAHQTQLPVWLASTPREVFQSQAPTVTHRQAGGSAERGACQQWRAVDTHRVYACVLQSTSSPTLTLQRQAERAVSDGVHASTGGLGGRRVVRKVRCQVCGSGLRGSAGCCSNLLLCRHAATAQPVCRTRSQCGGT